MDNILVHERGERSTMKKVTMEQEIIDYYYNPNLKCTCEAIFDDTHRNYCKRRQRPKNEK